MLLGDSGWANRTIAAATVGGAPALWVRDKTTGELDLYQGAEDAPAGSEVSTKTVVAASGWTASGKPMLAGEDIDVDGEPDLWAVAPANNGTLSAYLANGPGRIGGPLTLGSGWIPWYSSLS